VKKKYHADFPILSSQAHKQRKTVHDRKTVLFFTETIIEFRTNQFTWFKDWICAATCLISAASVWQPESDGGMVEIWTGKPYTWIPQLLLMHTTTF